MQARQQSVIWTPPAQLRPDPGMRKRNPVSPLGRTSTGVWLGVGVAWAASLTPSLLPRPWHLQGVVTGSAIAGGYLIGRLASRFPTRSRVPKSLHRGASIAASAVVIGSISIHYVWHSDVRRLMGITGSVLAYLGSSLALGVGLGVVLILLILLLRRQWHKFVEVFARRMSFGTATGLALASLALLTVLAVDLLVAGRLFPALNSAFLASSLRHDPAVTQPRLTTLAGGPGSAIDWDTMGRQGREFVAAAPTLRELESFNRRPGQHPIRVYAGLASAGSATERARLAVHELERTGGFEREVIALVAPTGTGWVDPSGVEPLEFMYNGDTAAVAIQYSHLPSWVVLIGNQDLAIESSRALFEEVSRKLASIDQSVRPKLLLYGQSLGSFGLEALFEDLDDLRQKSDGALFVGPSRSNRIWQQLMAQRTSDSPIWRPVVDAGIAVRFGPDSKTLSGTPGPWYEPRVVYLQHPSDPITWLTLDMVLEKPEWLDPPTGEDVSRWMPFVPIVTFGQVLVDLVVGTNAPIGHGHKFGTAQSDVWALIAQPDGWSEDDVARLREHLDTAAPVDREEL